MRIRKVPKGWPNMNVCFIVLNVVVKDVKLRRLPQQHRAHIQNPVGGWRVTKILSFTCSINLLL